MDADEFRARVEESKRTELDRLGSELLLVALTEADLSTEGVLAAAADGEAAARETFAAWADDEDHDRARDVFAAVADREADHYDRVVEHLDEHDPARSPDPLHEYLRGLDDVVERVAAGLVARGLVADRTHLQLVSYFVNEADGPRANLFRDLRSDTREDLETGLDLLDELCDESADWNRAASAAERTVQLSYDAYADSLTDMGLDPKPVC